MKSVLIIDDDDMQLSYIRALFLKFFPSVKLDCASTFANGISLLSNNFYSLIILDLCLPDNSVLGVLTGINTENKVPILVLSGREELTKTEEWQYLLLDTTDFVSKDLRPTDLVKVISTKLIDY